MSKDEHAAITDLKETVVTTAAAAVVDVMTPAMLRKCAEGILETALADIAGNKYNSVGRKITELCEKEMQAFLETDNAKALIKSAVIRGANAALEKMSSDVQQIITSTAMSGLYTALTTKPSRY